MRALVGRNSAVSTRSALISLSALAAASLWPAAASAQVSGASTTEPQDQAAPAESTTDGQAIIVTGSRLARTTFDTPSPVTVLGAEELDRLQKVNVGQAVSELPAFRPSNNPSTNGFGSFNVGAQIVNLRGLGVTRNLVLVDGRRFAPTTREGSVDLNFIPSTLVSRVEVVTGGASAAYGSDAVAGVVNVILDTRLQGLKAQVDYGISQESDGENLHAGIGYGTQFAGGAGRLIIGGEYSDQQKVGNCFTRDWCKVGAVVTNTGFATNNGNPNFVRSDTNAGWFFNAAGVVSKFNNTTGIGNTIANSRGTGAITFGTGGSVQSYQAGTLASGLTQLGGDLYPTYTDVDLIAPVERYTGFAHLEYDFSDRLHGFVEGSYGHVDGATFQSSYFTSTIPIFADNPYIPAAIRAVAGFPAPAQPTAPASLTRPATATFSLARSFDDLARGYSRSKADTYRATTGLSGDLGKVFSWDLYYQYGRTDRLQTVDNNLVVGDPSNSPNSPATIAASNARFFFAADAVINPATGLPTCRALLSTDPALRAAAAGCVPINLFGTGNVSQQGKDYIYAQLREDIQLQQHVVAANLRGETPDVFAGPLSFAVGAEYRIDKINVVHDPLSNIYAYFQNFGSDYNGETKVAEGYLEAELPLMKDMPGARSVVLNGALRLTHYDITGFGSYLRTNAHSEFDATTWKISLNWEPLPWLRVRATQSRDIRAPNFAELFLASASSFAPVTNPFVLTPTGARTTNFPSTVNGGSPTLHPEKGDTSTIGMIIQPTGGAFERLRISVDYYRIKVRDYIGAAPGGGQFLIDRCFLGVTEACAYFDRNTATGAITTVRNITLNLDRIVSSGIDFEADYRIPLSAGYQVGLHAIATYVRELKTVSLGDTVDRAGQTGNSAGLAAPDWVLNGTATLMAPRWSLTLQGRYINSGLYDAQRIGPDNPLYAPTLLNSISDNRVDSRFYVNLFGSVFIDAAKRFEVFGSVSNLFNTDPPAAPETQFYTNPVYFDTLGRYFRVGARVKL
jgi:outer membrane receptor protein involved in Fe transport